MCHIIRTEWIFMQYHSLEILPEYVGAVCLKILFLVTKKLLSVFGLFSATFQFSRIVSPNSVHLN